MDTSGFASIAVTAAEHFKGAITVDAVRYVVSGTLPGTNPATITIPRAHLPSLVVTLRLDAGGAAPQLIGSVTNGTSTAGITAGLLPVYSKLVPSPLAGRYTVALYSSTDTDIIPGGAGYAIVTVAINGATRIAGALADGTPFSESAAIGADGFPLYIPLYAKAGVLTGMLTFNSISTPPPLSVVVAGQLDWLKPATSTRRPYPASFSTTLTAAGSSYNRTLGLTGTTGILTFAGSNLTIPFTQPFTLTAAHALTLTPPRQHDVTYTLNPLTGIFSGTFINGARLQPYHGVILQQQDSGAGDSLNAAGSGPVTLTVSP